MDGDSSRGPGEANEPAKSGRAGRAPSSRERRIRKRADYVRIQKSNVRVHSKHFVLLLSCGLVGDLGRVGITTSRKIGGAVVRNRARRLVREALRQLPRFVPAGIDMVVVVRMALDGIKMQDVKQELGAVESLVHKRSAKLPSGPTRPQGTSS